MKRIAIIAVALVVIALIAWNAMRDQPIAVALVAVDRGDVRATVANTRAGTVKACKRARLAPQMGGQIAALYVQEGQSVAANELLLELWNEDLKDQVVLAEKDLAAASASAVQACVVRDVARKEADRLRRLREQGLVSEEALDRAVGEARSSEAACSAGRSLTPVKEAALQLARDGLERSRLRAPFAGTVAEINGEAGEFITPSPVGIPTPPAIDLVDNSCLYIAAPIDEVDAPAIETGMPAEITMDAFPGRKFEGHVRRIAPYVLDVEKQARTVEIEAEFSNPMDKLLPGYSADVEVILAEQTDVVRIPSQALIQGNTVLLFDPDGGVLRKQAVTRGISNWEFTEITDGLKPGQRVVISVDRPGLVDGARVEPETDR